MSSTVVTKHCLLNNIVVGIEHILVFLLLHKTPSFPEELANKMSEWGRSSTKELIRSQGKSGAAGGYHSCLDQEVQ